MSIPFEAAELGIVWDQMPHQVDDGLSGEWGLSVADFDNDGNLDMYIPRFGPGGCFWVMEAEISVWDLKTESHLSRGADRNPASGTRWARSLLM